MTCSWPNNQYFLNLGMEKRTPNSELDNLFINLIFPALLLCFQNDCPFCDFWKSSWWGSASGQACLTHRAAHGTVEAPAPKMLAIPGMGTLALEVHLFLTASACWCVINPSLVHGDAFTAGPSSFITGLSIDYFQNNLHKGGRAGQQPQRIQREWKPSGQNTVTLIEGNGGAGLLKEALKEVGGQGDWGQEGSSAAHPEINFIWGYSFKRGKELLSSIHMILSRNPNHLRIP